MICPVCGGVVATKRNRCERCGEDLTIYKKMFLLSNKYYNEGLEKAKVRDLSGAILVLKKSLEYNKSNINARNLLGLVYYEMGETVSALSEWVISKHFKPTENDADDYVNAVQSNPTKLDTLNQTIKKYNAALVSAKQGNEDLAIIQLKKVTSLNPHFVKAWQLLALLYMKTGENEKAVKCLLKASKIDVSNTTTLRYLGELGHHSISGREESKSSKEVVRPTATEPALFQHSSYKEEKPNVWLFINLIIGVAFGILGAVFLVVPTVKSTYQGELKQKEIEYNEGINKYIQTNDSLEKEKTELESQITALQAKVEEYEGIEYDDTIYDGLMNTAELYIKELEKGNVTDIDYVAVADALTGVKEDKLEKQPAKELYASLKESVSLKASDILYNQGHSSYSSRKYDKALEQLLKAYEYNTDNVDAAYFLGRTYHQQNDIENAKKYYTIVKENFPDSNRASEASDRLAALE